MKKRTQQEWIIVPKFNRLLNTHKDPRSSLITAWNITGKWKLCVCVGGKDENALIRQLISFNRIKLVGSCPFLTEVSAASLKRHSEASAPKLKKKKKKGLTFLHCPSRVNKLRSLCLFGCSNFSAVGLLWCLLTDGLWCALLSAVHKLCKNLSTWNAVTAAENSHLHTCTRLCSFEISALLRVTVS